MPLFPSDWLVIWGVVGAVALLALVAALLYGGGDDAHSAVSAVEQQVLAQLQWAHGYQR